MLTYVKGNRAGLFGGEERTFVEDFRGLRLEGQAMVVRWFKPNQWYAPREVDGQRGKSG